MSTTSISPLELAQVLVADGRVDAAAHRWLAEHGWPDRRQESWRSAPLAAIVDAAVAPAPPAAPTDRWEAELERRSATHPAWTGRAGRVVVVDGAIDHRRSSGGTSAVTVATDDTIGRAPSPDGDGADAFELLNRLASPAAVSVEATAGRGPGGPAEMHLVHVHTGRLPRSHPRIHLRVGAEAALTLVETHWTIGGDGLVNATTAIEVGERAQLTHLRVLDAPSPGGAHLDRTTITVGADAEVHTGSLVVGSVPARSSTTAELRGCGASVAVAGLAVPGPGTHLDTEVSIRHLVDGGTSRQHHTAVVADGARSSFGGHVLVAPGTIRTDADQQSHNLLLGPTARADGRPWLEIYADDVACTHGATVGRLDDDGLFYLRSRGIGERVARRMLVRAFADATIDRLAPAGVTRDWLHTIAATAIDLALDGACS